ncbi:MAG TPA: hypothetical protein VKF62_12815 [Planctomycetota bacterium]|nr:hypothetical protein [Planctomycetota bacterium]
MVLQGVETPRAFAALSGGGFPAVESLLERITSAPETFVLDPGAAGIDWSVENRVRGVPNRARIKCWSPKEGTLLVWFYKRSALPWSVDRFSYGGVLVGRERLPIAAIDAWLRYQVGGFHPEQRPPGMRRSFPFDLPA